MCWPCHGDGLPSQRSPGLCRQRKTANEGYTPSTLMRWSLSLLNWKTAAPDQYGRVPEPKEGKSPRISARTALTALQVASLACTHALLDGHLSAGSPGSYGFSAGQPVAGAGHEHLADVPLRPLLPEVHQAQHKRDVPARQGDQAARTGVPALHALACNGFSHLCFPQSGKYQSWGSVRHKFASLCAVGAVAMVLFACYEMGDNGIPRSPPNWEPPEW